MELRTISSFAFVIGFFLYLLTAMKYRTQTAPPPPARGGFPLVGKREWFTPLGYALRVAGVALWAISGILSLYLILS